MRAEDIEETHLIIDGLAGGGSCTFGLCVTPGRTGYPAHPRAPPLLQTWTPASSVPRGPATCSNPWAFS